MRWNRELNPIVVGVVCLVGSLLVLDQSFRIVFRDVSKAVVLSEDLLAEFPIDNLYRRLAAVKTRIRELESDREVLQKELQVVSGMSRVRQLEEIAQIDRMLPILHKEEQRVITEIVASPPGDLAF